MQQVRPIRHVLQVVAGITLDLYRFTHTLCQCFESSAYMIQRKPTLDIHLNAFYSENGRAAVLQSLSCIDAP